MKKLITFLLVSFFITTKLLAGAVSIPVTSGEAVATMNTDMATQVTAGNTDITLEFADGGVWGSSSSYQTLAVPAGVTKLTLHAPSTVTTKPVLYFNTITYADALMVNGIVLDGVKVMGSSAGYLIAPTSVATKYPAKVTIKNCWIEGHRAVLYSALATTISEFICYNNYFKNIGTSGLINVNTGSVTVINIRKNTFNNVGGDASGSTAVDYFIDFRSTNAATSQINFSNNTIYYPRTQGRGLFRLPGAFSTGYIKENNNLYSTGNATTFALQLLYTNVTAATTDAADSTNYYSNKMTLGSNKGSLLTTVYTENTPSNLFVNPALDNFTINDANFAGKIKSGNPACFYPATVNITGGSVVNLDYNLGTGPSTSKTFSFSTIVLRGAVTLTAPTDYEISTDNSTYSGSLILGGLGSDLTNQTIYVRLKAGLAVGTYNESITVSTSQASNQSVSCSGSVTMSLPVLDTPTDLSSSSVVYTGFHTSWIAVANATSYTLRVLLSGSAVATITGISGNSYDVTGLTPGSTYTYAVTAVGDAVNYNSSLESAQSGSVTTPFIYLFTSLNTVGAGTVTKNPSISTYSPNASVQLTATKNFGYAFVNWVDSVSGSVLSTANPYTVTMDGTKHIKAVFNTLNTFKLTVNVLGGANSYMVSASPAATVVNGNNMYEDGTVVTLTASNNSILTFSNWSSGSTTSTLSLTMNQDQSTTATYSVVDYLIGWDFYKSGGSSRPADFYSTSDNSTSTLILRKTDGTVNGWLDKSIAAAGGYYSRGAAVSWRPFDYTTPSNNVANGFYYQTSFVATDFTNIKVAAAMLYNYNAYSVQKCEYSLDNSTFTTLGTYTMTSGQIWYNQTFDLPADANHAARVYVRWIPDYTSTIKGSQSATDGTSIAAIYITGTQAAYNDGLAPSLSSSVPASDATNASSTGSVVLNFSKNVQVAGGTTVLLGGKTLTPVISGKTITFSYTGLNYNTLYTFTLAANTVSDAFGNTLTSPISFNFTTMNRPVVTKKAFDFVVGVDGDFKAAVDAATAASSSGNRYRIFFPNGQYNIGAATGNANQMTTIALPNVSFVGQSADGAVLYNKNTSEGISSTATMYFTNTANNLYLQDLSLKNGDYRSGVASIGRCAALQDYGTKNIYKNVNVLSNQDTYYSGSGRNYFEGGSIHGTVDFLCGGGDVYFNETLLYLEDRSGNCITAPATTTSWGYVFSGCTIDGFASTNGNFNLGRPWQNSPRSIYINTKMNVLPTAAGWTEMGVVPALFAEYNSTNSVGATVDISMRKTSFTYSGVTTPVNPYLTADQAAQYTVDNVLGGSDAWQPKLYTDQASAPTISGLNRTISWDDNNYVLCWGIFKDGNFVQFVTTNSYTIPNDVLEGAVYTVRAANEMGGLGAVSNLFTLSLTTHVADNFRSKTSGNSSDITSWESSSDNINWISATSIPTSASSVAIQNGHTISVNSNLILLNMTLNTGSILNVNAGIQLAVSTTMVNNGTLNLLSTSVDGTATILTPEIISGTGTANVQQYLTGALTTELPSGRFWYVSSPVTGATSSTFTAAGRNKIWNYTESTHGYNEINANDSLLTIGRGYAVRLGADTTVTFTGALNTGSKTFSLTRTDGNEKSGYNLIGNPYPSFLDWHAVTASASVLPTSIWTRSCTAGGLMAFDTYNASLNTGVSGSGKTVTQYIAPMQAFWVKVTTGNTTGTVTVSNAMRHLKDGTLNSNLLKAPAVSAQQVLRLQVSNGINSDETVIAFNANASDGFDNYDSPKMSNNNVAIPEIYTMAGTEKVAINGMKNLATMPLVFTTGEANTFSIKATEIKNFDADTKIILIDNQLGLEQNLTDGTAYSFTSDASTGSSRFSVVFKTVSLTTGIDNNSADKLAVNIFKNANGHITINRSETTQGLVTVTNAIGQKLVSTQTTGTKTVINKTFSSGVYFVTLNVAGSRTTKKVIIN